MKISTLFFMFLVLIVSCKGEKMDKKKSSNLYNNLTKEEKEVIVNKKTEKPFSGQYINFNKKGTYICKRCELPLYNSSDKFESGCGWPSFDDEIPAAVKRYPDKDGKRIEIVCSYCDAHLGHVFKNEGYTEKNIRHCVNSISMKFVPAGEKLGRRRAIFAAGCFWGVESLFKDKKGVLDTRVGYTGGNLKNPTYQEVSSRKTNHAEALEIIYNPSVISYEKLVKLFFEIHDFTQVNRQGPDIGKQYRSEIFFINKNQKEIATKYKKILKNKGYEVATKITKASTFWPAEEYHQNYYQKTGKSPYCHYQREIF
ncbi:MAG: bifunctional methionine sulfoxide reductase B/A protein [Candidatus Mcinerneyibacterium aminivorans]|uniref:Peptide methionine sulfoxide reductase MsrA n=1 Tax=Candidatus Mcinerneyibacterium aminivorans TaxID=2703815 RepID=A0A5D0MI61_9BACT|nr:MAG: bifunctional methionine sulfoxide reductase B/A protein [Candidatus Mcinerneyibacterium aminivorans]